jgi:hypothetical protein
MMVQDFKVIEELVLVKLGMKSKNKRNKNE